MKFEIRPFFAILLCSLLAITGQSMAVARGAAAATGQMVICSGETTKVIYTDARGLPTAAPHVCPDCVMAFEDVSATIKYTREIDLCLVTWPDLVRLDLAPSALKSANCARGPPLVT